MATGSITAAAWLSNGRILHHRTRDHFGTEIDTTVVLASAIGPYPAGMTVHDVIVSLESRISTMTPSAGVSLRSFTADAFVQPRLTADAVLRKTRSGTFTAYGVIGTIGTIQVNAVIKKTVALSFTANAVFV